MAPIGSAREDGPRTDRLRKRAILGIGLLLALWSAVGTAQEWPGFRGRNGSAVSEAQNLPVRIDSERAVRWKVPVPFGRSSPILTDRAVVVTGSDADGLQVVALDRGTGERLWSRTLERARVEAIHSANDSAAPTPTTDGRRIFAFFPELGLVGFDAEGEELWRHPLGPFNNYYGMSSSPVLAGKTLLQLCDQQQGSYLLALDATTGKQLWRVDRQRVVESFTTPVLYPAAAPRSVIVSGSFFVHAYSIESGRELWHRSGFAYSPMPSPTVDADRLYVCSPDPPDFPMPEFDALLASEDEDDDARLSPSELEGSHLHFGWLDSDKDGFLVRAEYEFARAGMAAKDWGLVALDLSKDGAAVEAWRLQRDIPLISSPLLYRGLLYLVRDGGILTTVDATSGEMRSRQRLPEGMGSCFASPVAAGGKVWCVTNAGRIFVLEAGDTPKVLATHDLGEECFATPAIGERSLYVRTTSAITCFGEEER
ncbi:MAG: PQQ-binding-like beta-propeller repeat protein [Planctomycetota bacterium]